MARYKQNSSGGYSGGSHGGGRGDAPPTNNVLMPLADPLKVSKAEKKKLDDDRPPAELLGTGSKIPESHDSRMRSQFAQPGDNYGKPRKLFDDNDDEEDDEQSWWTDTSRPPSIGISAYKGDNSGGSSGSSTKKLKGGKGSGVNGGVTPHDIERLTRQMAKEQAQQRRQQRALENQKDHLLRTYCDGPSAKPGSAESHRVMGQVSEINRQLGLPPGHFGNWKIPT